MSVAEAEDFRETADEIVSRPEFREEPETLVDRALEWLGREFSEVFQGVLGATGGYYIGYAILAVALALAGYFVWKYLPRRRLSAQRDDYEIDRETTVRRSREEWLRLVAEAEAAGRWDEAVHARYHAMTSGLADDEVLPAEVSTTSGEHRRAFATAGDPASVPVFDRATDRYEQVWFGGDDAAKPDSEGLAEADRQLVDRNR